MVRSGRWRGASKRSGFEGEGVVGADVALFLDEEQFVVGLIGREEANPVAIQGEAVQRASCPGRNESGRCSVPRPSG